IADEIAAVHQSDAPTWSPPSIPMETQCGSIIRRGPGEGAGAALGVGTPNWRARHLFWIFPPKRRAAP
ncbi:MAG: hypothetical protein AAB276_01720, partial [Pseudomonadota bacterium]